MEIAGERIHALPEDSGNFVEMHSEEIFDLRAGDEDGDAIGESDDDGPGNEFHASAKSGRAHDDEQDSSHDGAHEQAVNAVNGDDPRDHDDERAGRAADLSLGSAEGGDQESGDHRAVDAGLRRESRGDGKCHREWKGDEADCDAGDQVKQELVAVVVPQADDRLRKPAVVQESTYHFSIIAAAGGIAYGTYVGEGSRRNMSRRKASAKGVRWLGFVSDAAFVGPTTGSVSSSLLVCAYSLPWLTLWLQRHLIRSLPIRSTQRYSFQSSVAF